MHPTIGQTRGHIPFRYGKGEISSSRPTNKGVPQGSVLGPLLFLIYINNVSQGLPPATRHLIYADDLQVYTQFSPDELHEALANMSIVANCVADWAAANKLKLNAGKTKAIICGSQAFVNRVYSVPDICIHFGDTRVPLDSSVRSLGVVLDSKLTWRDHVMSVSQRVHSVMYRLRFFRPSTSLQLRTRLVESLVFPLIDYCCLVYDGLSAELSLKLQRLVNLGIRYIFGARRDEHVTPYRLELGWLTCEERRKYFLANLTYKILSLGSPDYLAELFVANMGSRPVRGHVVPLIIPRFGTKSLKKSFYISAAYLWNSLPSSIRDLPSLPSFKAAVREFLLSGSLPLSTLQQQ